MPRNEWSGLDQQMKNSKANAAHEVGETRVETHALEYGFYIQVPQPDIFLIISFFQAGEGLILLSESYVNKRDAVPRYISALRFLQVGFEYVVGFRVLAKTRVHISQCRVSFRDLEQV